ncbi:MAG: hypothetical protein H0T51_23860 [Pirellulales bacterium]|nr:hypothetical protein [Pirellulales bacterium]
MRHFKARAKAKVQLQGLPGELLRIYGCEISGSREVTDKLVKLDLDSIEGRLSFFEDGRYLHGAEKITCGIAIAITQDGRTGLAMSHVECWPHDALRESRRATNAPSNDSLLSRLKNLLN